MAGGGRGVGLEPQCSCLPAVKVEAEAPEEVGGCQGRRTEDSTQESPAGHTRVWSRQGAREGEYRAGV